MTKTAKELILSRKSVRTFDGDPLSEADRRDLNDNVSELENPFGVPVTFRLLNAKEYGLSSPVIVGEKEYLAAKAEKAPNFEIAFGYCFEKACLYARSRGIGTVMLAASLNRSAFERAMEIKENEVMPVASPVGYPAKKKSVRETLMRKGLKADDRKPFEKLFFRESFEQELCKDDAGDFAEALDLVRFAPSAANGQPWRAVVCGDKVHFYEAKTMKDSPLGDVQKVDIGIALAHFDMVLNEQGVRGKYIFRDPGLTAPEKFHYIVTFVCL